MDIYTVDEDSWVALKLIEGYSSMIWTERFSEAGSFEMSTPLITQTRALLPPGTLLTHTETREIMRVETHEIDVDDEGVESLKLEGRSYVTRFEDRILKGSSVPWPMLKLYTVQDAVSAIIWNAVANTAGIDVTGGGEAVTTYERIPPFMISQSIVFQSPATGYSPDDVANLRATQEWWVSPGEVYKQVLDFLKLGKLGLRAIRPPSPGGQVLDVSTDGTVNRYANAWGDTTPRFDIYNGQNRTVTPSPVNPYAPLIFRHDAGHLEDMKYLTSIKGFKNYIRLSSMGSDVTYYELEPYDPVSNPGGRPSPVGPPLFADLYMMYLDAGNMDDYVGTGSIDDAMLQRAKIELNKTNLKTALDCSVTATAPYKYKRDYDLGDYVTLRGAYGVSQNMQVAEYVFIEDRDGERGYPTLIQPV